MKIHSITINNFQSYYGEHGIEFSDGLNLIIGNGGKGKSKLFNAFYWVLFGQIYITSEGWCKTDDLYHSSHKALRNYEFINKRALKLANKGEDVTCSVILELFDDHGDLFTIERTIIANRTQEENWDSSLAWTIETSTIKVTYPIITGDKTVTGSMAESKISELFPPEIRGYIWFQGESLDELIDFRNKENLREAVNHISYYTYYDKLTSIISLAKEKIQSKETKKLKEANKNNAAVKSLLSTIDFLEKNILREKSKKESLNEDKQRVELALIEDESKINGIADFSSLVHEYDKCEQEIAVINEKLNTIDEEQRSLLPTSWILRGIDDMIVQCKKIIASHVEVESTAPEKKYLDNPSRAKLEEILYVDHRCFVCGSPVDEAHPHAMQWILDRLRMQDEYLKEMEEWRNNMEFSKQFNIFVGKIQDYPDSLLVNLKGIDKKYQDMENEVESHIAKRRKFYEKKANFDKQIEDIKKQYGVDPKAEVNNTTRLKSNIKVSRGLLDQIKRKIKSCEDAIEDYNKQLTEARLELNAKGGDNCIVTKVAETEQKNISIFLEHICKTVKDRAREELKNKIEERSNDFYEKFTEHDRGYKGRVEINDDYTIEFDGGLNTSHEDRKKMSIINALLSLNQEALGIYYPFISDAPTSSFDPDTTHKYLLGIKDIFDQTIIMTKDVIIDSDNYNEIVSQKNIGRIYQLSSEIFCEENKEPEIHEISTKITPLK